MKIEDCHIYNKHHNTINGIYMLRKPTTWDEIPDIDKIDADDEDGELYALFQDVKIYDIDDIPNFKQPIDKHNIIETIFIIRNKGNYYLCETQGENFVKFSTNISKVDFIKIYDRFCKIKKIKNNINI